MKKNQRKPITIDTNEKLWEQFKEISEKEGLVLKTAHEIALSDLINKKKNKK